MSTNRFTILFSALIVATCGQSILLAGPDANGRVSVDYVAEILPRGIDMLDEREIERYQEIVDMGAEAHPALREIMKESDDPFLISRILGIFARSAGDKTVAIEAIRELLARDELPDNFATIVVRTTSAEVLGLIGRTGDAVIVYPLLVDNSERVRVYAVRAIARIGGPHDKQHLKAVFEERRNKLSQDEFQRDMTSQEIEKAIGLIRDKHLPVKDGQRSDVQE